MNDDIRGKRVLISGAGTGIGTGIALAFADAGAQIAVHYSHSSAGANEVAALISRAGGKATAIQADFNHIASIRELAMESAAFLGGLDVLINNAGITVNVPFEAATEEQFDTLYRVNIRAPFFLTQAVLPYLLESRGSIINMSSIHAFRAYNEHSMYAATRGAIVSFSRELAIELAPRGVRVNCIAPGAVPVQNHFKLTPGIDEDEALKEMGKGIPCGFVGRPDDIGGLAVFLASRAARYIVGQTIVVDGGTTSWMPFGEGYRDSPGVQFGKGYIPGL
jgi:NAD(P)-dependent dehydrogenase (short-subunit alcohol dehydrogenase family)